MQVHTPSALIGAMLLAGAAVAQTPPAATTHVEAKTTTTAKATGGAPPKATQTTHVTKTTTKPMPSGRMVTTKTKTGKTITYDCSKAGNAGKAACKK